MSPVQPRRSVSHVCLDKLKHLAGFFAHSAVIGHQHGFLDGAAVPGQHVGDGDSTAEQALGVHVQVLASPVGHVGVWGWWLTEGGVG